MENRQNTSFCLGLDLPSSQAAKESVLAPVCVGSTAGVFD